MFLCPAIRVSWLSQRGHRRSSGHSHFPNCSRAASSSGNISASSRRLIPSLSVRPANAVPLPRIGLIPPAHKRFINTIINTSNPSPRGVARKGALVCHESVTRLRRFRAAARFRAADSDQLALPGAPRPRPAARAAYGLRSLAQLPTASQAQYRWAMARGPISVLELAGRPRARGRAHGEAYAEQIRAYAAERLELVCQGQWSAHPIDRARVVELAERCVPAHTPTRAS